MASKTKRKPVERVEHAQMFPNWVYQVPGFLLITLGFGSLLYMTLL